MHNLKKLFDIQWPFLLFLFALYRGDAVWAQDIPQVIIGHVVSGAGSFEIPLAGVLVRLRSDNGMILTATTDAQGQFTLRSPRPLKGPMHLLYFKYGYKTRIKRIERAGNEQCDAQLESSFFTPENINLSGYVLKKAQQEAKIFGAMVYADNGVYRAQTDQAGFFQLPISLEPNKDDTYLWLEAENYDIEVLPLQRLRQRNQSETLTVELTPSTLAYTYHFEIRRRETNEILQDTEIRINGTHVGKTDENGVFSGVFQPENGIGEIIVDFLHHEFLPTRKRYRADRRDLKEIISLEPPTFYIEPLIYYQADDSTLHLVSRVKYSIRNRAITPRLVQGRPQLSFKAIAGDTLRAELIPDPMDSLQQFPKQTLKVALATGQKLFGWHVEKHPLKVNIEVIGSSVHDATQIDHLYLVQGGQWFKAERRGSYFEIESRQLRPPKGRRDWQVLIMSTRRGMNVELVQSWQRRGERTIFGRLRLIEKAPATMIKSAVTSTPLNTGTIKVETKPPAAAIRVEEIPALPAKLSPDSLHLPEGRFTLSFKKEGYVPQYRVIEVKKDSFNLVQVDLGDPFTPLSKHSNIKIAAEIGIMSWFLRYPQQEDRTFPTVRAGGNLLYSFSPKIGVKVSYFAGKVPGYYLEQIFAIGMFGSVRRWHGLFEFRENTFEASKNVLAKFDGSSLQTNLWLCLGAEKPAAERLPFLAQYRWAMLCSYETSFRSINKTVSGPLPREQEVSIGFLFRSGRGFFDSRLGFILDDVAVMDEKRGERADAQIARFSVRYIYFLN